MDKDDVKNFIRNLPDEEYVELLKSVARPHCRTQIVNFWLKQEKKEKKLQGEAAGSSGQRSNVASSLPQSNPQPPGPSGGSSGQQSKAASSLLQPWQQSAWRTGFIFRGDKVPNGGNLFLDVEKVTLKKSSPQAQHVQTAATVALVNEDGKLVLWAFIRIPHEIICQYCKKVTNLDREKLKTGVHISVVHECLRKALEGNRLVGAAIQNDLKSLDFPFANTFDLQTVYYDAAGPFALGIIAAVIMMNRNQFQAGHHSAIDDARMTLSIYKYYKKTPGAEFHNSLVKLSNSREWYKKHKPRYYAEKCQCRF